MLDETNPYVVDSAESPPPNAINARRQLLPVAVAILVTSILYITGGLYFFAYVYMSVADPSSTAIDGHALISYCMFYGITMLYCLLLISGAFSMMRRGSYMWSVTVCVLSMIPLLGPCYVIAVPFGVWGLIVLKRPNVRDSFSKS